ncbi:MAG: hypothetical protein H6Q66_2690 [Firmicutes bacterium]|nr:hypothetical protein [Bacillota bacterium]
MGYGMMDERWFGGGIFMLLIWVAIIVGVFYLVRLLITQSRATAPPEDSALEILKKRYARGEISREEFEKMKADIS